MSLLPSRHAPALLLILPGIWRRSRPKARTPRATNDGSDARGGRLCGHSGPPRLPARKYPRSELPERPACASEGCFRGGAPAPLVFRPSCAGRPARPRNSLTNKGFWDGDCFAAAPTVRPSRPGSVSPGQFPRNSGRNVFRPDDGTDRKHPLHNKPETWFTPCLRNGMRRLFQASGYSAGDVVELLE